MKILLVLMILFSSSLFADQIEDRLAAEMKYLEQKNTAIVNDEITDEVKTANAGILKIEIPEQQKVESIIETEEVKPRRIRSR